GSGLWSSQTAGPGEGLNRGSCEPRLPIGPAKKTPVLKRRCTPRPRDGGAPRGVGVDLPFLHLLDDTLHDYSARGGGKRWPQPSRCGSLGGGSAGRRRPAITRVPTWK